jgi:hypothetical protein
VKQGDAVGNVIQYGSTVYGLEETVQKGDVTYNPHKSAREPLHCCYSSKQVLWAMKLRTGLILNENGNQTHGNVVCTSRKIYAKSDNR